MSRRKKIVLIFMIILTLLVGSGIVFTLTFKEEIKAYGIRQLNETLRTEIQVGNVEFSIVQKFPQATVKLEDVRIMEMGDKEDKKELCSFQSFYLQFNTLKILKGEYVLEEISLDHGKIDLKIDKNGHENYHFWGHSSDSTNQFALELKQVHLTNIELSFENEAKEVALHQTIRHATAAGKFSEANYDLALDGNIFTHSYRSSNTAFVENRNILLDVLLSVDSEKDLYTFKKGKFSLEKLNFSLTGDITLGTEANLLNIKIAGYKLPISSLRSLIPETHQEFLEEYKSEGEIEVNGRIRGWLSASKNPELSIDFGVRDGMIEQRSSGMTLTDIHLKGHYSNGSKRNLSTSSLTIDSIRSRLNEGQITGSYSLNNLKNPLMNIQIAASDISLEKIHELLPMDTIREISGLLNFELRSRGQIDSLNRYSMADFLRSKTVGKASVMNGILQLEGSPYRAKDLQVDLLFNNNDVKINALSGSILENDFRLQGYFKNLLPYLFTSDESLFLDALFLSSHLNLDDFMAEGEGESTSQLIFPDRLIMSFKAAVDEFRFRDFQANHVRGKVTYANRAFTVEEMSFASMGGNVDGFIQLDGHDLEQMEFSARGNLNGVDITKLFTSFDHFGQDLISAENLKGTCHASIQFTSMWDYDLKIDPASISAVAKITLEEGELIDYEPVYALSRFIKVEELNHIRFSSLSNEIEIRDRSIFIPEMEIKSSALNLNLSGKHGFDNTIDYHFSVLLRDILSRKARKAKKENEEFGGKIEDDGLGRTTLFLKMTGTVDDPKIAYDRKGLRKKWNENLRKEKATVKSIFKEEFGKREEKNEDLPKNKPQEYNFDMEWEEDDQPVKKETKPNETKDTTRRKKGFGKWLNKVTQPDEEEYEEYDPAKYD